MTRPLIGIAHSMGCAQLINLSIMHPRILSALILYEPIIINLTNRDGTPNPAATSTTRRDIWDSRSKAEATFRKAFKSWDPRALEAYLKYGLREVPTALYNSTIDPTIPATAVTLTTTKHQEAWSYTQANFETKDAGLDRLLLPDWDQNNDVNYLINRTECSITMRNLPHLRPNVLYIFGGKSPMSSAKAQDEKMETTGSGIGGSGGVAEGKVEKAILPESGHLLVFEDVKECAIVSAEWTMSWFRQWLKDEKFLREYGSRKSDRDMRRGSEAWVKIRKATNMTPRPVKGKL